MNETAGALPEDTLNGLLNGHQAFRLVWLLLLVVSHGIWFFVGHVSLFTRSPFSGVNVGTAFIFLGFLFSEFRYRKKWRGKWSDSNILFTLQLPDLSEHRSESNCAIVGSYPFFPFLDLLGSAFIVLGTGGVSSPFLSLLLFVGFVGSLAVYTRPGLMTIISVVFTMAALVLAAVPAFEAVHSHPRDRFEVDNAVSLQWILTLAVVVIFLWFSGKMTARYARDAFLHKRSAVQGNSEATGERR